MANSSGLLRKEFMAAVWLVLIVVFVGVGLAIGWLYRGLVTVFCIGCLGVGLVFGLALLALACTGYGLYSLGHWTKEALVKLEDCLIKNRLKVQGKRYYTLSLAPAL